MGDWKLIYSTSKLYLAQIINDVLDDNNIDAVLLNKQDSFYLFGDIEIYVKPDDVIRAKFLLKDI